MNWEPPNQQARAKNDVLQRSGGFRMYRAPFLENGDSKQQGGWLGIGPKGTVPQCIMPYGAGSYAMPVHMQQAIPLESLSLFFDRLQDTDQKEAARINNSGGGCFDALCCCCIALCCGSSSNKKYIAYDAAIKKEVDTFSLQVLRPMGFMAVYEVVQFMTSPAPIWDECLGDCIGSSVENQRSIQFIPIQPMQPMQPQQYVQAPPQQTQASAPPAYGTTV